MKGNKSATILPISGQIAHVNIENVKRKELKTDVPCNIKDDDCYGELEKLKRTVNTALGIKKGLI